ncbi:hypothetical protein [Coralloluteibacterium thermophilus]|uniref:DUF3618 domain-containing protein n=1 Tax=Coralloluteibacterium thermophilum TaxID=2707049 RepID=A0ABV9NF40_9GAMM
MTPPNDRPSGAAGSGGAGPQGHDGTGDLGRKTEDLADSMKAEGRAQVENVQQAAADNIDKVAESVRAAAAELEDDDVGGLSHYVTGLAEKMTDLSNTLRERSGDDLLRQVSRLARENPALFVAGGLAVGFGLSRFARASASGHGHRAARSDAGRPVRTGMDRPGPVAGTSEPHPPTRRHETGGPIPTPRAPSAATRDAGFTGAQPMRPGNPQDGLSGGAGTTVNGG